MSIPLSLLKDTLSRAVGFATYGGPGLEKTRAARTLVPKIRVLEFESGSGALAPWIHRSKKGNGGWTEYTQEEREHSFGLFTEEYRKAEKTAPAPLIDLVSFDPMRAESYDEFVDDLGNFSTSMYNSLVIDAAAEFSQMTQSFSKGAGQEFEPMKLPLWAGAQERAGIAVRRIRSLREAGIFIYITGGEEIDKDYEQDPRALKLPPGATPPQPYLIKGSIQVPGKLVGVITHAVDNLFHGRMLNGQATWVAEKESISGGSAYWEAKDRWGRLGRFNAPNFKHILVKLYGKDNARAIYAAGQGVIQAGDEQASESASPIDSGDSSGS